MYLLACLDMYILQLVCVCTHTQLISRHVSFFKLSFTQQILQYLKNKSRCLCHDIIE